LLQTTYGITGVAQPDRGWILRAGRQGTRIAPVGKSVLVNRPGRDRPARCAASVPRPKVR
jgi:hypothetical protein